MNLVILGSARGDSNTLAAVKKLSPVADYELIDLRQRRIAYYDYAHPNDDSDDFLAIVHKMLEAETIIFATPVYWYAMSGIMKVFFDRFSELLSTHKPLGKALKGRQTYLIASGAEAQLPPGFEIPFKLTSEYFKMTYVKAFYLSTK
jgi:multimeric flavodoxin WrbA